MKYPEKLNKGDYIGVTAISCGIDNEKDMLRVKNAIKNIEELGYKVKITSNCMNEQVYTNNSVNDCSGENCSSVNKTKDCRGELCSSVDKIKDCRGEQCSSAKNGRSSSAKQRADEFMSLYKDDEVKAIIFLEGGDFACEMLEYLDFDEISKLPPKWIQGYSDCTNLTLTFNTLSDVASIYGPNFKGYGMENLHISLLNAIRLMEKEEFVQNSYEKCETFIVKEEEENPYYGYELTEEDKWINLNGEEEISFKGRAIGGCIDLVREVIIGSKFDKLKSYCDKYKNDGIVWIIEEYEGNTPENYRTLWRMRNIGLFENVKGIIFGRPLMIREDYKISYKDSIIQAIGDLNIPIIIDADIGHLAPQIPIVTGGIVEVNSKNGKGTIKNYFI